MQKIVQQNSWRLEWAERDGGLVHVRDAARGKCCGCVCPKCGDRLIARKGPRRRHHFAHTGNGCCGARESALHKLAKEILACEKLEIVLPEYRRGVTACVRGHVRKSSVRIRKEARIQTAGGQAEVSLGSIRPDTVVQVPEWPTQLIVEVRVTNGVDRRRTRCLRQVGRPAVEIDLSRLDWSGERAAVRAAIEDGKRTRWLFAPGETKKVRRARERLRKRLRHRPHSTLRPRINQSSRQSQQLRIPKRKKWIHPRKDETLADYVAKLANECGDRFGLLPVDPNLGRTAFGDLTSHWQLALYVGLITGFLKQEPGPDPMFFDRALSWLCCFIDVRTALDTKSRRCNAICSIREYLETLVRTGFLVMKPWE